MKDYLEINENNLQGVFSCFVVDSIIKDFSGIYIYGTDRDAARLFFQLCSLRISIEGFISEGTDNCPTFFHKPIYTIEHLEKWNKMLIPNGLLSIKNGFVCKSPFTLHDKLNRSNVVIYGAGYVGRRLKRYLEENEVEIKCFVETDSNKIGTIIDEKPVYGYEVLHTFSEDVSVIEAGQFWQDIDEIVCETNVRLTRFYLNDVFLLDFIESCKVVVDWEKKVTLSNYVIYALEEHFPNKKLILYGADSGLLNSYAEIYSVLGRKEILIATDNLILVDKENIDFPIIDIVEVLYEDNFIILLHDKSKIKQLYELGLRETVDFVSIDNYFDITFNRELALDINLGHTYVSSGINDIYPCMHIYGANKEKDFKVVVLGGSTTESDRSLIKPWVEFLFNTYLRQGVTIFNCAMSGYSSGQELIKLIRDAILLKPDLVITYSGVNDIFQRCNYSSSFAFPYLCNIFGVIAQNNNIKNVITGKHNEQAAWERWITNMQYMNAIAELNNIPFCAFAQPMLPSKKEFTPHEKKMMKMIAAIYPEERFEECIMFRKKAGDMETQFSYVYDLTDIFDDVDVYMDNCHVYEEGNRIIADRIWHIIKDKISTTKKTYKE